MKKFILLICLANSFAVIAYAQDTYSIVALDTATREVGSAGASCVDLTFIPSIPEDFLSEIFPDTGAINTQAAYSSYNQANAKDRIRAGDLPPGLFNL